MNYNIILLPVVEDDISAIIEWYGKENADLSRQFLREIEDSLNVLSLNPYLFQLVVKEYRYISAGKFPHKIIYRVSDTNIIVIAVIHHKRHPRSWKRRA